ncbi:MAG: ABC transporter ATP-binding protein [Clostridiales bacterium]|nr:ABC transporter ATP-binding protein [Clostridiales bacterium]
MNIEMEKVTVRYGLRKALKGVSHTFEEGKIHVLLGPNGCGKTTLLKKIVDRYHASGELAYVPQEVYGNVALTVFDTVALGRYDSSKFFAGVSDEDRALVQKAIDEMEMTGMEERIFDTLSGGEKQRVMIARALAQDAPWTLLDEPSSSLDVRHSMLTMNKIRELKSRGGKSFILVLHDINMASSIGDEFVLMKDGQIMYETERLSADMLGKVFDTEFGEGSSSEGHSLFYTV